ncbi:hypothetical protein Poli38472_005156 [Pythium oligandrum]|uniref:Nuclear segregation protein n=1 Tax=Pythium oligandrum TaxID=41045 RepID=A0A8K1CGF3_PYTOL|nr:hypothetical protein Poli38472_005156 [Pythium oligandrum]|eukprot:TMW62538.1 hypothetical protein Poli38472_005156 [Pythium oligandrum]
MSAAGSPRQAAADKTPAVEELELEIPDVIPRLPKPDKAAHDAEIAKLDGAIKKLQERTNVIRTEMDKLKGGRGGYGEQIQAAKAVYNELRSQKDNLIQQRNQITARVKVAQEKKDTTIKSQRSLRSNLRFQTEEEFDNEINALRHQQETRSMSLNEEKRLVKEIEALQVQKKQVTKVAGEKDEVEKQNDSIKEIRALQAKKNAEIDAVQEKLAAQKVKLDELYKLNDEEKKQDKFPVLAKERKEIKEELDAKFKELKELRAAFKAANDKYFENVRLLRKKRDLERKKEDERKRLEYEAKLAEYEKELAKIHPYQDEMDLCDALVAFIEKTFAKELKEDSENADANANAGSGPAELDGLKPLQRKEEEFMSFGGGKKKKGKKDGPKKTKRDAKLSLPLAQLESFSTIGLMPPSIVAALADSLTAIKEKKVWFNEQTSRPKADKPVEAAAPAPAAAAAAPAKSSPKKKGNKKFNAADASAFPTLGGAASTESYVPAWGPGMAPPAPVAVFEDAVVLEE